MAVELASSYVSILPSAKGFASALQREIGPLLQQVGDVAGRDTGKRFGSGIASAAGRMVAGVGKAVGATLGVATVGAASAILAKGFGRLTAIDTAKAQLAGLGHSAVEVQAIMGSALAAVKGTAFGLDEAAKVAATAVAAGIKPGHDLQRVLGLIADAATIAGTSMGDMGSIFNKVAASGKLTGDVTQQLQDRGIPIIQLLATSLGKSTDEVLKLQQQGKISFADFATAMQEGLGGAALKSGETFIGALKNVGAAAGRLGEAFLSPFLQPSKDLLGTITGLLDQFDTKAKQLGERLANSAGFKTFMDFVGGLKDRLPGILDQLGKFAPLVAGAGTALATFGGSSLPLIGDLIGAVNPLVAGFAALALSMPEVRDALSQLFGILAPIVKQLSGELGPVLQQLIGVLGDALGRVLVAAAPLIGLFAQQLGVIVNVAGRLLTPVISALANVIGGVLGSVLPVVTNLFQTLAPILEKVAKILGGALGDAFNQLAGPLARVTAALAGAFADALKAIAPVLPRIADALGKVAVAFAIGLGKVLDALAPVLPVIGDALAKVAGTLAGALADALVKVAPELAKMADAFANGLAQAITELAPKLPGLVDAFTNLMIAGLPIAEELMPLLVLLIPLATQSATQLLPPLTQLAALLARPLTLALQLAAKPLQLISELLGGTINWVSNLNENLPAITQWFQDLPGNILAAIGDLTTRLIPKGLELLGGFLTGVGQKFLEVSAWFGRLGLGVLTAIPSLAFTLVGKGLEIIGGFLAGVGQKLTELPGKIGSFLTDLPGKIGDVTGKLLQVGKDLVTGIVHGIEHAPGAIVDAIKSLIPGGGIIAKAAKMIGLATGGIVNFPTSGGLAILHGREAVLPLDDPARSIQILAATDLLRSLSVPAFAPAAATVEPGRSTVVNQWINGFNAPDAGRAAIDELAWAQVTGRF